ncbi:hypothetical protein NQ176_g6001 [Zarea fungicola]|uniref:Uncharacterized protein n=1 Tax=Zarea fungicola TaxID=93591 RepID=A0ACC1N7W7_9HYPO|nr:hypothetical protein NQ176_g6001 [Lecanicillium fungicola]
MLFQNVFRLSLVALSLATPLIIRGDPPPNAVFFECKEGTKDPICLSIKQPFHDVTTEITHFNGTKEVKKNLYSRSQLQAIREENQVISREHAPHQELEDRSEAFIANLTKRDWVPLCRTETQRWYDTQSWGYWYQNWHQVGSCFYCDYCSEAIATSFAVTQTWTVGLNYKFGEVITATFSFAWGQTFTITDTRTCRWRNVENNCHSIWYQPLMTYHNGNANYQTHTKCLPRAGLPGYEVYYDHNWAFANVNQAGGATNGVNQGNLGCNSGCGGWDKRQCVNGNFGGSLWPNPN